MTAAQNGLRLGVNIDHVATIRNARGGAMPDPLRAAQLAEAAGADGITAHLREDRRHISEADIVRLIAGIGLPLNLEMAATPEMRDIALRHAPHAVCIVPEKRQEVTTEGGLDLLGNEDMLRAYTEPLSAQGSRVSLFIDADNAQIDAAMRLRVPVIELHTGAYCAAHQAGDKVQRAAELARLQAGAAYAAAGGLEVHAGHGLCYETVTDIAAIGALAELNIGHFLIGEAVFRGLAEAMSEMRRLMDLARS